MTDEGTGPSRVALVLCAIGAVAVFSDVRDFVLDTAMLGAGAIGLRLATGSVVPLVGFGVLLLARLGWSGAELASGLLDDPSEWDRDLAPVVAGASSWIVSVGLAVMSIPTRRTVGTLYYVLMLALVALALLVRPMVAIAEPEDPWERDNPRGFWLVARLIDTLLLVRGSGFTLIAGAWLITGFGPEPTPSASRAPAVLGALGALGAYVSVFGPITFPPEEPAMLLRFIPGFIHVVGWMLLGVSLALYARAQRSILAWLGAAACLAQSLCCCGLGVAPIEWDQETAARHAATVPLMVGLAGLALAALGLRDLPHRSARLAIGVLAAAGALAIAFGALTLAVAAADERSRIASLFWAAPWTDTTAEVALSGWLILMTFLASRAAKPAPVAPSPAAG